MTEGRSVRAALNVPPGARPDLLVVEATPDQRRALAANATLIAQTLRIGQIADADAVPEGAIPIVIGAMTLALTIAGLIDLPTEKARLTKEIAAHAVDIARTAKKLASPDFVAKAPEEVVEENRERLATAEAAKARLEGMVVRLGSFG